MRLLTHCWNDLLQMKGFKEQDIYEKLSPKIKYFVLAINYFFIYNLKPNLELLNVRKIWKHRIKSQSSF